MSALLEKTVAQLAQRIEQHYYGKYRAIVIDNEDPELLGRLKLQVPSLLGDSVVTGWASPCLPYGGDVGQGLFCLPEVGAGVWVEFEEGLLEYPIWVGTYWSKPNGEVETPKPNGDDGAELDAVAEGASRKLFKTLKGHSLQFEDKDGEEMVLLLNWLGDKKRNLVVMTATGISVIQQLDEGKQNRIDLTESGMVLTDVTGNELSMTDSAVNLVAKVAFTLDAAGQTVTIKASSIEMKKS